MGGVRQLAQSCVISITGRAANWVTVLVTELRTCVAETRGNPFQASAPVMAFNKAVRVKGFSRRVLPRNESCSPNNSPVYPDI